mmetsp:Transcript_146589/g.267262  ORF Transcript_146589/g.267262 Transcript_146589/m.267262 type:complete len:647 (+) Transcript_146589:89-2029(+)
MAGAMLSHCCVLVSQLVLAALAASESVGSCPAEPPAVDTFNEALHLRQIPHVHSPNLFLATFEFSIGANLSTAFLADQFDVFPKPLGKLVNGQPSLSAFEATLTRGRWKDEWGPLLKEFRPSGALLTATTESDDKEVVDKAWRFLISALSGTLCASFEGMDPGHVSMPFVMPMQLPWKEPGRQLQFATLPYEPICTENLTPWLKLLPCGRKRGLASLIAPLAVAEAPLVSLSLTMAVDRGAGHVELRTSLDVVLPLEARVAGLRAWFPQDSVEPCPSADDSRVFLRTKAVDKDTAESSGTESVHTEGNISTLAFATSKFAKLQTSHKLARRIDDGNAPKPWAVVHWGQGLPTGNGGLSVTRDIVSQEGQSERTHGRYLLRFTNDGPGRRVRFMEQLPFFLSPMWHTFRATLQRPGEPAEELTGLQAMQRLRLKFVPPVSGQRSPTEVFFTLDMPPGGTVSVFLDVLKKFIKLREFSYACEKGFDVSAAAWLEVELPQEGNSSAIDDFIKSLGPAKLGDGESGNAHWRLRFTSGLIVLVPMPDFSMPFNVISLSSTALTFFFGSIFRLTAAGRQKHWVSKEPGKKEGWSSYLPMVPRILMIGGMLAIAVLNYLDEPQIKEFKETWPPEWVFLADFLLTAKDSVGKFR